MKHCKSKQTNPSFSDHHMTRLLSRRFSSNSEYDEGNTSGTEALTDDSYGEDEDDASTTGTVITPDVLFHCYRNSEIFQSPRPSKVRFQSVEIREYPIIPGDNPGCTAGPPLTIAWEPVTDGSSSSDKIIFSVDYYERIRRNQRREYFEDLRIPPFDRSDTLKNLGFSRRAIQRASSKASKVRKQRMDTSEREKKMESFREWKKTLGRISCSKKTEGEHFNVTRIQKSA